MSKNKYGPNLEKVIVYWQDTKHSGAQLDLIEAKRITSTEYATVGFLLKRGKRDIIISGDVSIEQHYRDITAIPRKCINRIDVLKTVRFKEYP